MQQGTVLKSSFIGMAEVQPWLRIPRTQTAYPPSRQRQKCVHIALDLRFTLSPKNGPLYFVFIGIFSQGIFLIHAAVLRGQRLPLRGKRCPRAGSGTWPHVPLVR